MVQSIHPNLYDTASIRNELATQLHYEVAEIKKSNLRVPFLLLYLINISRFFHIFAKELTNISIPSLQRSYGERYLIDTVRITISLTIIRKENEKFS